MDKLITAQQKSSEVHPGETSSFINETDYRRDAWTEEQLHYSNGTEFEHETNNPSGYVGRLIKPKSKAQKHSSHAQVSSKWGQKLDSDYNRISAWTEKQLAHSNETSFDEETNSPSGYEAKLTPDYHQKRAKTYAAVQIEDPPATIWRAIEDAPAKPNVTGYTQDYRGHAWTEDQHDASNETAFIEETRNPSGYLKNFTTPKSFVQKAKETYPAADSKSWIEPYNQRDHAWNESQYDQSNNKTWHEETENPTGYQVTPYSAAQKKE